MKQDLSLPRLRNKLTKAEYKLVFDRPKKINQKHWLLLYRENQKSYARLGTIVAKQVASQAVTRNRIKRVLRESFRHQQHFFTGIDIIVITRRQCSLLPKTELRKRLDELWVKLLNQLSD